MRRFKVFLSVFLLLFAINAQSNDEVIKLTFSATYDGEWTPLDRVLLENLSQGGEYTIFYPDTVMELPTHTGIGDIHGEYKNLYVSQNYPNPFSKKTNINVGVVEKDDFTINIYDVAGRELATYEVELEPNLHNFTFYACSEQMYILTVKSKKHLEKQLMIQTGPGGDNSKIVYNGTVARTESGEQSSKTFPFKPGDVLRFTGYKGEQSEEKVDTPNKDTEYTFKFKSCEPNAPVAKVASDIQGDSFKANWNSVTADPAVTKYLLDVSEDDDFSTYIYEQEDVGNNTEYTVSGLDTETEYYYRVYAVNNCGESKSSNVISVMTTTGCVKPDAPVATAATNIEGLEFTANWDAVTSDPAVTHYLLDVSEDSDFSTFILEKENVGDVTDYVVTGLTTDTEYFYRVFAVNSCGQSDASNEISVTTICPLPDAPVATEATYVDETEFTANWDAVISLPAVTHYLLDVSEDSDFSTYVLEKEDVGDVTEYELTDLDEETQYFYRVFAVNECGQSDASNVIDVETAVCPTPDEAPIADPATDVNADQFKANWQEVTFDPEITSYLIDVSTESDFSSYIYEKENVGDVTEYIVTGLDAGTEYFYRVYAFNMCGESDPSNEISVTTTCPVPSAVNVKDASDIGVDEFRANWLAVTSSPEVTHYLLDVSLEEDFGSYVYENVNVGNNTEYLVDGLDAGTEYYYRVFAVNSCGVSDPSKGVSVETVCPVPGQPVATDATDIENDRFTANWEDVTADPAVTHYLLDVTTDSEFDVYNRINVGDNTEYVVEGLDIGTDYFYRVFAVNSCGTSKPSIVVDVTTLCDVVPDAPVAQDATDIGAVSFVANWDAVVSVPEVTGYNLRVREVKGGTPTIVFNQNVGNVTEYKVGDLNPDTDYIYIVIAINPCGTSDISNEIDVTTLCPEPDAPTANEAGKIEATSFVANWDAVVSVPEVTDYNLVVVKNPNGVPTQVFNSDVGDVTQYEVEDLEPGTEYGYIVRAINSCGNSTFSDPEILVTTLCPTPDEPTANPASNIEYNSFVANWDAVVSEPEVTDYNLRVIEDPNGTPKQIFNSNVGNVTEYIVDGLDPDTEYAYVVRAINPCGNSSFSNPEIYVTTLEDPCNDPSSGDITFTYNGEEVTYGIVRSGNRCWLDRNLGASQVATAIDDEDAYGDLFQWGREDDGHQERDSDETSTLADSDQPGHDEFIKAVDHPNDWREGNNDNRWNADPMVNNPCPLSWAVPSVEDWNYEVDRWSSNDSEGAFNSPLKLTAGGYRGVLGSVSGEGTSGAYWSSSVLSTASNRLYFDDDSSNTNSQHRVRGSSVRCIMDKKK